MKKLTDSEGCFFTALLLFFFCAPAVQANEDVSLLEIAAADGSSEALIELALFYGQDEENKDELRAFDLLLIAANRFDSSVAQINLGVMYQFGGDGIEVDESRAAYWYSRAARSGSLSPQSKLADMYSRGIGTPASIGQVDYNLALDLYQSAAEQGNVIGQYNLAEMYELGKGTAVNLAEARRWYSLAAEQGLVEATDALQKLQ